jgi:hypothetical protein
MTLPIGSLKLNPRLAENPEIFVTLKLVWDEWTSPAS